jgi:hypothetical protein
MIVGASVIFLGLGAAHETFLPLLPLNSREFAISLAGLLDGVGPRIQSGLGSGVVVVGNSLYFAAGSIECGGGGRSNELLVFNLR